MAHQRDQIGRRMAGGEVAGREPSGFRDLLLAVAGIEERAPKLLCVPKTQIRLYW